MGSEVSHGPKYGFFALVGALCVGCFSAQHEISQEELDRLAHEDPDRRGQDVRVTQLYAGQEREPPPGQHRARRGGSTTVFVGGSAEMRAGGSARGGTSSSASGGSSTRAQASDSGGERGDSGPRVRDHRNDDDDDARVRDHRDGGDDGARVRDHRDNDDDDGARVRDHRDDDDARVRDHRDDDDDGARVRDHRDDDDDDARVRDHRDRDRDRRRDDDRGRTDERDEVDTDNGEADDAQDTARRILTVAAVVGGGLAVTRGMRYEGWVDVDPDQPVHLIGPGGEFDWVPLSDLRPEDVRWAREAYISEKDGGFDRRGRAPLNRDRWTYSVFFGAGQVPLAGDYDPSGGFLGRFDVGYFPAEEFGLGADFAFGWTQDENNDTVFDQRIAGQLQLMPFQAGRLHGGLYGQFGGAVRADDGFDETDSSALLGTGGMLQFDLTTTLALTARGGLTHVHGDFLGDVGLGISIY